MSSLGLGNRNGASVVRQVGVAKTDVSSDCFPACTIISAASISSFNQPIALALRFSYGQCSSVSRMKAKRTWSDGWACRIEQVKTWAWYRSTGEGMFAESKERRWRMLL